ncbi:MAG TPA: N-acetyltransferase [Planctomycetota bacterium]|nr:N-acetyltransferase [Planctomycetota bacterium]
MSVEIVPAAGRREMKAFLHLPFSIYPDDPNWVPPLLASERKLLDRRRHPFHRHAEVEYFLARRDGRWVGRIAAIVNREHLKAQNDGAGFWGFFESERDPEIGSALFGRAEAFLRSRGLARSRGPMNFSVNETCGLLVDGFDSPPYIMMPHNPPWYAELVEKAGYAKAVDLLAFRLTRDEALQKSPPPEKLETPAFLKGVKFRCIDRKRLREEIKLVNVLFNDAWSGNWGFVPMTEPELEFMADDLKMILDPRLTYVAEVEGRPIAFAIALPNINPLIKKIRGRLFPFGWLRLLLGAKKVDSFRVCLLGVRKDHQKSGIGILFCFKLFKDGLKAGARAAEMSWILETNRGMIAPLERMGATPYKRYRIYEKPLVGS